MAHIPDGFLSLPVAAGTAAAAAGAVAYAARRSRETLGEREGPVLGAATAFVFAAQMLNFPLGLGASAHLLGAALLAVLLGPWAGMLVLFAVLLVQALLFQDGGVAALGANTLNLAVLGVGSAAIVFRWLGVLMGPSPRRTVVAAAAAAWASSVVVGVAVAVELALSDLVPLGPALLVVGGAHVAVGVAEAALTALIVGFVLRVRPALVPLRPAPSRTRARVIGATVAAIAVAAAAVVVASGQPDVLETALHRFGLGAPAAGVPAPMPDYVAPVGGAWLAAAVGLIAAFLVTWGFAIAFARRRP